MSAPLIVLRPVEPDLSPERIDRRLAAGWFPFGQAWMTCRVWPNAASLPEDTVWIRNRLQPPRDRKESDRLRRLRRDGATEHFLMQPCFDAEHQVLYDRFRDGLHPEWGAEEPGEILLSPGQVPGPLLAATREMALRDAAGRLLAFRWFVQGQDAIAGITAVYDPKLSGAGTIARDLADRWAERQGLSWTYPGYVRPGAPDPWDYKLKAGRTEWLDPDAHVWRVWDGDAPRPEALTVAELRRRLGALGEVRFNPTWAEACFNPRLRGLDAPFYVESDYEGVRAVTVWDLRKRGYELMLLVERVER